jgi:hypothetical protein
VQDEQEADRRQADASLFLTFPECGPFNHLAWPNPTSGESPHS